MDTARQIANRFLSHAPKTNPSPLLGAAMSGNLDSFLAREVVKRLEGKDTITLGDIRKARNSIFEGK